MSQRDLTEYPSKEEDEVDRPGEGSTPDEGATETSRQEDSGDENTDTFQPMGEELPHENAVPPRCLSFTVSAPFAHFRKIETSSTRLSYGIPPRTTVNGLIAAILGLPRDSYYELFSLSRSAISITPVTPIRAYQMPIKHRNTDPEVYETAGSKRTLKIEYPKPPSDVDEGKHHQRVAHTMLRDVSYRIDVWISTEKIYDNLRDTLSAGESHYTPSLGLSECLASITYHGEFTPDPVSVADSETVAIDSAIPQSAAMIQTASDTPVTTEQTPAEMRRVETPLPSRRTTAYTAYQFREDAGPIPAETDVAAVVDDLTVIFR